MMSSNIPRPAIQHVDHAAVEVAKAPAFVGGDGERLIVAIERAVEVDDALHEDRVEHAHASAGPGAGCVVSYTATNWPGAFTAKVTISNRGSTSINGWSLTFRFPGDDAVSSAWNATFTQTGTEVSARNTNYDGTIQPGASQSAWLTVTSSLAGVATTTGMISNFQCAAKLRSFTMN